MPEGKIPTKDINKMPQSKNIYFDVERYDSILNCPDIPEETRLEALNQLWTLIVNCVDFGFGVHPLPTKCEQVQSSDNHAALPEENMLQSKHTKLFENFAQTTNEDTNKKNVR